MNEITDYVIVWFPPDAEIRKRIFSTESAAQSFVRVGERDQYAVRDWNPILTERTTVVTERQIPIAAAAAITPDGQEADRG